GNRAQQRAIAAEQQSLRKRDQALGRRAQGLAVRSVVGRADAGSSLAEKPSYCGSARMSSVYLPPTVQTMPGAVQVPFSIFRAWRTGMQDDLFGDALLQPSTDSLSPTASRAKPEVSALRGMAKVLPAPGVREWSALARQLPAQLRFGVSTWSYPGWE